MLESKDCILSSDMYTYHIQCKQYPATMNFRLRSISMSSYICSFSKLQTEEHGMLVQPQEGDPDSKQHHRQQTTFQRRSLPQ